MNAVYTVSCHIIIILVPSRPTNLNTSSGDFSLNISTETVIGASFYTFAIPSVETVSSANQFATFTGLSSGTIYNITSTATKTTSYGNFTSSTTTLTAKTSEFCIVKSKPIKNSLCFLTN